MKEEEIREHFRRFCSPLAGFVTLGARKETVEEIARNLWAAMIGGPAAEKSLWEAMRATNSELVDSLQHCFEEEMKPCLSRKQLEALRDRYEIRPVEEPPSE